MNTQRYNDILEELRQEWRQYPHKREILRRQARAIEIAKEKHLKRLVR